MTKPFGNAGEKTVVIRYAGDELVAASEETLTLAVREAKKSKKNK